jgi:hypothetical protein
MNVVIANKLLWIRFEFRWLVVGSVYPQARAWSLSIDRGGEKNISQQQPWREAGVKPAFGRHPKNRQCVSVIRVLGGDVK